jgi:hypothetical protein
MSGLRCADGDKDETAIAGADMPCRLGRHRDELFGLYGHFFVVDNDDAGAMDDGIHVLGSVIEVIVAHGFCTGRKLNLIDPKSANTKCLSDALIETTGRRMRARGSA